MILRRWTDRWGREIALTEAQWTRHVLPRHPIMAAHLDPIAATLRDPTAVTQDIEHADRRCFYRLNALPPPLDHLYLKVVVEFAGNAGFVVTTYPLPAIRKGELPVWP